ncbi:hypothetical protein LzC2_17970 [Planctomycetes bacterium LzC2]|uniref:Uncharacterized protein n=1 Tax=Alienimonas chondri TaxID=2681879 RepID=A0ABX1VCE9_9PLAN|nr:hypothetical protein [Alienimonas chondri]
MNILLRVSVTLSGSSRESGITVDTLVAVPLPSIDRIIEPI